MREKILILIIFILLFFSCKKNQIDEDPNNKNYEGKKILVIHSYHPEHKGVIENNNSSEIAIMHANS